MGRVALHVYISYYIVITLVQVKPSDWSMMVVTRLIKIWNEIKKIFAQQIEYVLQQSFFPMVSPK